MPNRNDLPKGAATPAGPSNAHTRAKIEDALIELLAESDTLNHERVAERAGVSRRTVYRYFPDQAALRAAAWARIGPPGGIPRDLDDLIDGIDARFANFDEKAAAMTVVMASAEGRAIRNVMKPDRVAAFREILAKETAALPEPDRTWAIAAFQFIGSAFAWREMRDQWDMTGAEAAVACRWIARAMLADLARRGARPLSEGASD